MKKMNDYITKKEFDKQVKDYLDCNELEGTDLISVKELILSLNVLEFKAKTDHLKTKKISKDQISIYFNDEDSDYTKLMQTKLYLILKEFIIRNNIMLLDEIYSISYELMQIAQSGVKDLGVALKNVFDNLLLKKEQKEEVNKESIYKGKENLFDMPDMVFEKIYSLYINNAYEDSYSAKNIVKPTDFNLKTVKKDAKLKAIYTVEKYRDLFSKIDNLIDDKYKKFDIDRRILAEYLSDLIEKDIEQTSNIREIHMNVDYYDNCLNEYIKYRKIEMGDFNFRRTQAKGLFLNNYDCRVLYEKTDDKLFEELKNKINILIILFEQKTNLNPHQHQCDKFRYEFTKLFEDYILEKIKINLMKEGIEFDFITKENVGISINKNAKTMQCLKYAEEKINSVTNMCVSNLSTYTKNVSENSSSNLQVLISDEQDFLASHLLNKVIENDLKQNFDETLFDLETVINSPKTTNATNYYKKVHTKLCGSLFKFNILIYENRLIDYDFDSLFRFLNEAITCTADIINIDELLYDFLMSPIGNTSNQKKFRDLKTKKDN